MKIILAVDLFMRVCADAESFGDNKRGAIRQTKASHRSFVCYARNAGVIFPLLGTRRDRRANRESAAVILNRTTQMPDNSSTQSELSRRYKSTVTVVNGLITLTLALVAIIVVLGRSAVQKDNESLDMGWRIAVVILGFCAIALRRTKFSAMRLQDIAALRGLSGLLAALQKTTVQVAVLGGAITIIGAVVSLLTGYASYTLLSAVITLAVLIYCYPRKAAWQRVAQGIEQTGEADAPSTKGNAA